jgi:hypothetical protein
MTLREELVKVAFEGIFAAGLLAFFGYLLSRALERFKWHLQWGAVLLQERLNASKKLLALLEQTRRAHEVVVTQAALNQFRALPADAYRALGEIVEGLTQAIGEATLVLAEESIECVTKARHSAFWFLEHLPAAHSAVLADDALGTATLSPTAMSWMQRFRSEHAGEIDKAILAVQIEVRVDAGGAPRRMAPAPKSSR